MLSHGELRNAAVNLDKYIEFYNGIARFLRHSAAFLYTSASVQMLKLHAVLIFTAVTQIMAIAENNGTRPKSE